MKTAIFILILTVITSSAFCKTITVTSSADNGAGTLRQAVLDAESGDVIVFADSITTIPLIDQLNIDKNITITGNAVNTTVLKRNGDGTDNKRHFHIISGAEVVLNNLTLQDSYTYCSGGAIDNSGTLTLNNCVLKNNKSNNYGGAVYSSGQLYVNNCTFSGNYAKLVGGAVSAKQVHLDGCTFNNNSSSNAGAAISMGSSTIKNCLFEANNSTTTTIENRGLTTIDNCIFRKNITTSGVAAIENFNEIIVSNSIFSENKGMNQIICSFYSSSHPVATIINCSFYKNTLNGSISCKGILGNARVGTLNIINSTIANNSSVGLGCCIDPYASECFDSIYLYNNIFYNNDGYDIYLSNKYALSDDTQGLLSNSFNNIIGTTNLPFNDTANLLNIDPLFVDSANNDYGLQALSPAIDAGNNSFYSYANYPKDLVGDYRIDNATIDIGAHEYQSGNPPVSIKKSNNDKLKIYTMDKNIVIANTTKPVYIYNLQGICVAQGLGNVFTVPSSGIYIVLVENQTQKVMVK